MRCFLSLKGMYLAFIFFKVNSVFIKLCYISSWKFIKFNSLIMELQQEAEAEVWIFLFDLPQSKHQFERLQLYPTKYSEEYWHQKFALTREFSYLTFWFWGEIKRGAKGGQSGTGMYDRAWKINPHFCCTSKIDLSIIYNFITCT